MANKLILEKKAQVVEEITSKLKNSAGVVFVDYRGLTDEEITALRRSLRENNADVKVYKNTLTKRALDSLNISLDECVEGPSALVYSEDAVAPIKVVTNFAKDHEALSVKGGIVDGKVSSLEELAKLATIPSRDGLLTMLAGGMIGIARDLSIALNLYAEQKEN
ncbi:MAG: 50S ribosomal protein L10 [Bacilli bacterium]|nr:50S ribosomal protein L10 [Bacilli bacterium]MBQ6283029.1 50S ribosomal protein L10 [Bacilli bacterium]